MRKNSQTATVERMPTTDEIASWIVAQPLPTPSETAMEHMRAIVAEHAAELARAFLKVSENA